MTGGWPASSTQCPAGCGLCCETVALGPDAVERIFGPTYDARVAEGGWDQPYPDGENNRPNPRGMSWKADADFMREHFHPTGTARAGDMRPVYPADDAYVSVTFRCDAFDPIERTCTRYDERPLMCENYPFYGRDPLDLEPGREPINDLTCAFQADAGRRILPLEVLRG